MSPSKRLRVFRAGLLLRLTRSRPDELGATLWAFVYFFALLAAYYVLRPIRDEMAILSLPTMSWIAVPVAGAWLGVALAMGRAATTRQREAA